MEEDVYQLYGGRQGSVMLAGCAGSLTETVNLSFQGGPQRSPVKPPPEPERKTPPIGPPKRDPKPEPINDPPVPPSPGTDPNDAPVPIGDPPDKADQPIRMTLTTAGAFCAWAVKYSRQRVRISLIHKT